MYLLTTTFYDALISILCNIISSVIFLFYILTFLRPDIRISPYVSKQHDQPLDQIKFTFKIINYSYFSAYDLQVSLLCLKKYPVEGSKENIRMTTIALKKDTLAHLSYYQNDKKCQPYALHAFLFNTLDPNIEAILKDDTQSLQFSVTAKHGLTGLSKNVKMQFATTDILKTTRFKFGNSLEVV